MAEFNPVFEIDASKLLAKLHLAGQQAIPNSKVINTGIKDNDPKADPNSPGKVTFMFSKSGEYQLSVLKLIQYRIPIDIKQNKNIEKADKELVSKYKLPSLFDEKAQEEAAKEEDKKDDSKKNASKEGSKDDEDKKKEADEKTSLTDKAAKEKTSVNDSLHVPSFLDFITEAEDKDDTSKKEAEQNQKEIDKLHEQILKELDSYAEFKVDAGKKKGTAEAKSGMKNMFDEKGYEKGKKPEEFDEAWKKFKECLTEENKHRMEYKQQMLDELNGTAIDDLKEYFINFAGKDNQAKIDQDKIAQIVLDTDGSVFDDPTKFDGIKDGKIDTSAVQAEMEKEEKEAQAKEPNKLFARSVGCAVGYKVDIE